MSEDRDCENCKHYKLAGITYGDEEFYACEKWECEFEEKDDERKRSRRTKR